MKVAVQVQEVDGEGLTGLIGQRVVLWGLNYIYAGDLVGVNDVEVKLNNAAIVYETGSLTAATWQDAQALPGPWYVRLSAIESYGASSK